MLGLFMVLPVLALHIDEYRGATPMMLGIILGAYGLAQAILQIPLGMLSDKIGRRPVILGGLALFVLGSVIAANAESAVELVVGRVVQGAGAIASTLMALVSDLTSEENRTKSMAAIGASIGLSFMLAMIIGPLISSTMGLSGIFWVTALLGLIGISVFLGAVPRAVSVQHNRETRTDTGQLGRLFYEPNLWRLNVGIFILHLVLMAGFVVIPTILTEEMGISGDNLWWVYLLLIGGGFFAMLPVMILGEKYRRQKYSFVSAVACMAIIMSLLAVYRGNLFTGFMLWLFFAAFNLLENKYDYESIINLQGDMPLIDYKNIQSANIPLHNGYEIGTIATDISSNEIKNENITISFFFTISVIFIILSTEKHYRKQRHNHFTCRIL